MLHVEGGILDSGAENCTLRILAYLGLLRGFFQPPESRAAAAAVRRCAQSEQ